MKPTNVPKWQKEMQGFLGIKSGLLLEGNVYDEFPRFSADGTFLQIDDLDNTLLGLVENDNGIAVFCDPLYGFYCYEPTEEGQRNLIRPLLEGYRTQETKRGNILYFLPTCNKQAESGQQSSAQVSIAQIIRKNMASFRPTETEKNWIVFVVNFASRLDQCCLYPSQSNEMFMNLTAATTTTQMRGAYRNTLVMVVDKFNDIPAWVYLNNPQIRTVSITAPDRNTRRLYLENVYDTLADYAVLGDEENEAGVRFVAETEGLQCRELHQVLLLARKMGIPPAEVHQAFQLYKYGAAENPWEMLEEDITERIETTLKARVKGQDEAVDKVLNVAVRAVKGLSGLHHSGSSQKPRGILFLAGPTGVGKTETAKALAQSLFGDESACIRFDMSEYREDHSDQKLFGAPPGYVGYEGGGQLTNAVKNRPFSVLLFDEIEKAAPTIMDKFLQILEDGRMTDSQGNTVYFGESIIIFTSNVGLTKVEYDSLGRPILNDKGTPKRFPTVTIEDPTKPDTEEFRQKVSTLLTEGVKDYFTDIGRPELLNRLGEDNIVVFQFINVDSAESICAYKLDSIVRSVQEKKGIRLLINDIVDPLVKMAIAERSNGGRGIGNMLEREVLNPLAKYLCDRTTDPKTLRCYMDETGNVAFEEVTA